MKKIEKIGMFMVPSSADDFIVDILAKIAEKTDEIIDHLNSQGQEAPERCMKCGKVAKEGESLNSNKDGTFIECDECMWEVEDTPEELIKRKLKEITTSERVGFLYEVGDDDLLADELYDYIKKLLEEREREVLRRCVTELDGALLNEVINKNLDYFNKLEESMLLKISKLKQEEDGSRERVSKN